MVDIITMKNIVIINVVVITMDENRTLHKASWYEMPL